MDADEDERDGRSAGLGRDRGSCGDVGEGFLSVRRICDVFDEFRVRIARFRRAGIMDDGLEGTAQRFE